MKLVELSRRSWTKSEEGRWSWLSVQSCCNDGSAAQAWMGCLCLVLALGCGLAIWLVPMGLEDSKRCDELLEGSTEFSMIKDWVNVWDIGYTIYFKGGQVGRVEGNILNQFTIAKSPGLFQNTSFGPGTSTFYVDYSDWQTWLLAPQYRFTSKSPTSGDELMQGKISVDGWHSVKIEVSPSAIVQSSGNSSGIVTWQSDEFFFDRALQWWKKRLTFQEGQVAQPVSLAGSVVATEFDLERPGIVKSVNLHVPQKYSICVKQPALKNDAALGHRLDLLAATTVAFDALKGQESRAREQKK